MSTFLEWKKAKRTGLFPAFFGGAILAAAVPVVNMAVRKELYLAQGGSAVRILMDANWQMTAMLNVLLIVAGTCLLYHTEYADGGLQKMKSLPLRESSVFFGKVVLTMLLAVFVLVTEAGAVAFCSYRWFTIGTGFWSELCKCFAYAFLLMLPCMMLSLLISQACRNMWVSLGIGVVGVFTATLLPTDNFVLSLFPLAMPFQVFSGTALAQVMRYICAAAAEFMVFGLTELILIKVRRLFA